MSKQTNNRGRLGHSMLLSTCLLLHIVLVQSLDSGRQDKLIGRIDEQRRMASLMDPPTHCKLLLTATETCPGWLGETYGGSDQDRGQHIVSWEPRIMHFKKFLSYGKGDIVWFCSVHTLSATVTSCRSYLPPSTP